MVICGATGDLTERKLGPALYNLTLGGFLPPEFTVVGFARRDLSDDDFREHLHGGIDRYSRNRPAKPSIWESFGNAIEYHRGEFNDPNAWTELGKRLDRIDRDRGTSGNRLFYLAVPPSLYPEIVRQLGNAGLARDDEGRSGGRRGWTRVIVEKPFGSDLETARRLNRELGGVFEEEQIYRIDHYLGKETVQNLAVFRFAERPLRTDLEPSLHRQRADHRGRDGRGRGARRVPTTSRGDARHRAEPWAAAASLFAMEPPVEFRAYGPA